MKNALTPEEVARLEYVGREQPIEGTYGALNRDDYPTLNAPSPDCGGSEITREWVLEQLYQAQEEFELNPTYANKCRITCFKMLLPAFVDELEGVQ